MKANRRPGPSRAAIWRRKAVRPVLDAYAALAGVDAVLLSGSTARGDADRWSDVEVGVFWSRWPTTTERAAIARTTGVADLRIVTGDEADPPWYDHVYLGTARPGGLMVEVVHALTSSVEDLLDTVLKHHEPNLHGLDTIKGIVDGRSVSGARADVVRAWQARAAYYPRGLAVAIVDREGAIEQFWRWRMLVERDNPLLLAREFSRIATQLLNVLNALNGRYCGHPSAFKRLDALDDELPTSPPRLAARLRSAFALPPSQGAAVLRDLVEETYDLIETHLPQVDVDRLRRLFRNDRAPLESLPTGSRNNAQKSRHSQQPGGV